MEKYRKIILLSLKIGIGSSVSLYIAEYLGLDYAISAGTITLLTLMTSKWETVKLAACRLATFTMTVLIAWLIFSNVGNVWLSYGLLLMVIVFIAEVFEWRATISVNGVIAAHLVTNHDFSDGAVWNEFLLVLIGIVLAFFFNLFHANMGHKKHIIATMRSVENRLQSVIGALADYLSDKETKGDVWSDLCTLEQDIQCCIKEAYEYQNNTFHSHPEYYIAYFEMRNNQCQILQNLHCEMKKIRSVPVQAGFVAEYMRYLAGFVNELNHPDRQISKLHELFDILKAEELPKTREEFENRALVYHIMMDLEDFLNYKIRFINELDETKMKIYWKINETKI